MLKKILLFLRILIAILKNDIINYNISLFSFSYIKYSGILLNNNLFDII